MTREGRRASMKARRTREARRARRKERSVVIDLVQMTCSWHTVFIEASCYVILGSF